MIDIVLKEGQSGYDAVGEYIRRYWKRNIVDTVIVSIGISYDGHTYDLHKEVATPMNFDDIEFFMTGGKAKSSLSSSELRHLMSLIFLVAFM